MGGVRFHGLVASVRALGLVLALATGVGGAGCGDEGPGTSDRSATIAGRALLTPGPGGALRRAHVRVDQLRLDDASGAVRQHAGDTTTDDLGRFELTDLGTLNGLFRVTVTGGEFTDLLTGTTVVLDPSASLTSLFWVDLFEQRTAALVSPFGALVDVLAKERLAGGFAENIGEARDLAADHLHAFAGNLDWSRVDPMALDEPATSPVDAWRAAVLLGGLDFLAADVRNAASASVAEVNVHTLTAVLAEDLARPPFDGNDGDVRGTGLQLGACPAITDCTIPDVPCPSLACRSYCDVFSGTLRARYSGAALKLVRDETLNRTGVDVSAFLPTARALADARDALLFGDLCSSDLDQIPPTISFIGDTPGPDAWVKGAVTVVARAVDDLDPAPTLELEGLDDQDGAPDVARAVIDTAARPDGDLDVRALARDATGNPAMALRSFRVDNTAPVVTVASTGFHVSGADWWTGSATPTLGGTYVEDHLADLTVHAGANLLGAATASGGAWSFTLPAGAVPDLAGADIRVEARDHAGNVASVTRRLRYDATPPQIEIPSATVKDERGDLVTFSTAVDPLFGVPSYAPTHSHNGTEVTLGPSTACDASAPTITKYAYLLDEQPPYVIEANGPGAEGRNPLRWRMTIADDGVGVDLATVAYRVRDVAAGTFPLDWTPLSGTSSYTVHLYRAAASGPSLPVLGAKEGLFEIQFRGRDRLGREVTATRCWNHELLGAPLFVGNPQLASPGGPSAPTNGPPGSGKYGLTASSFSLASTTPIHPVSSLMNAPAAGAPSGVGLMQFPIFNPTNETVYLSIDFTNPTAGVAGKRYYQNRWTYNETSANTLCGTDPGGGPDQSTPGCEPVANPGPGNTALIPDLALAPERMAIPATAYSVRVWEESITSGAYFELTQCPGCSTTPAAPGRTRVTVLIPPRGLPNPVTPPPRQFWIVPVLRGPIGLNPGTPGPYSEFSAGGVIMSGAVDETRSGCTQYTATAPFRCTQRRTYRRFRATWYAEVTGIGQMVAYVRTSWSTSRDEIPAYIVPDNGIRGAFFADWSSTEPTQPN